MIDRSLRITTHSPNETQKLGKTIGKKIEHPLVIGLSGDLGSGKTAFVQGLAEGLEVPAEYYITSPTFTLVNEYPGRFPLLHIDLYRLDGTSDFEDIGLDELLYDQAVLAIEWSDKMSQGALAGHLSMTFEIIENHCRRISLIGYGHQVVNLIKTLEFSLDRIGL
jgi:tRNA threonylcarbamoyladenosine biosynthesis protein TsaE